MSEKELVIRRTVTITSSVPFDGEHYPNMTLEQAVEYEEDLDGEGAWSSIVTAVQEGDADQEVSVEIVNKDTGERQVRPTKAVLDE